MNKHTATFNFLISFCLFFCAGILAGAKLPLVYWYCAAVASLGVCLCSVRHDLRFSIGICAFAWCLGASVLVNSRTFPAGHIAALVSRKAESVALRGVIVSDPDTRKARSTFVVNATELTREKQRYRVRGKVMARVLRQEAFSYGDEVVLTGSIAQPRDYKNFRYRDFLRQQKIYAVVTVRSAQAAAIIRSRQANPAQAFAFALKHKTQSLLRRWMSGVPEAVLEAMLLGEKRGIPPQLNAMMMRTGTVHILVVSGFNVGIVAFIMVLLLKIIRVPRRPRYVAAIGCVLLYCLMTGASVPVVRATVMAVIVLTGLLLRRQASVYQSLALAALIILCVSPEQLFNAGFQLSFASVFALVCFSPKIYALFPEKIRAVPVIAQVLGVFSVSLAAWLGTAGIIAYYFHTVSPIAIAANMAIAPLASLITAAGLCLVAAALVFAPLAAQFASGTGALVTLLLKLNIAFAGFPSGYFMLRKAGVAWAIMYYAFLFGLVFYFRQWYNAQAPQQKSDNP